MGVIDMILPLGQEVYVSLFNGVFLAVLFYNALARKDEFYDTHRRIGAGYLVREVGIGHSRKAYVQRSAFGFAREGL